jgi:hypothetical protein
MLQDKIDELIYMVKNAVKPSGITVLCSATFYNKLMHKLPRNMKIRYELRRRGLKPKHVHKLNRG